MICPILLEGEDQPLKGGYVRVRMLLLSVQILTLFPTENASRKYNVIKGADNSCQGTGRCKNRIIRISPVYFELITL
ncbi:hypothetical protein MNBD_GAMMA26-194 [hydrothermal vent metagenome]|uniref:Uncharacterized protein n=1 Tax=hydrothermal vent metagenome TaxID=652676 RepID=A0A3B1B847_9ZZZZ